VTPDDFLKVAFVTELRVPAKFGTKRRNLDIELLRAPKRISGKQPVFARSQMQSVFEV
jgi:hypothetical protein